MKLNLIHLNGYIYKCSKILYNWCEKLYWKAFKKVELNTLISPFIFWHSIMLSNEEISQSINRKLTVERKKKANFPSKETLLTYVNKKLNSTNHNQSGHYKFGRQDRQR